MNKDKYVFAQLVAFLDNNKFRHLVDKYDGNRYVKNFTCWNQLMALMFGQLCNRESLRDVVVALETHQSKCYHLGMGRNPIAKTTFATANQNRDYRIFEDFAFFMMEQARKKRATDIFKLKGNVYAFDSTTIPPACQYSGGQSSARRKEALRRMSFMIWSPKFLLSSILRLHRHTIQRQ